MTTSGKLLMNELKKIYDDHDFVCGTMSNCGSEEAWDKMLSFILYSNEHNKDLNPDDILALSLSLGDNTQSGIYTPKVPGRNTCTLIV